MPFRFVHAADIHLDSPLKSLALRNGALAELIGTATRDAFSAIIDLCVEEAVDALLIAGDLYDGDQTSMKTAVHLARELARLDEAGIPTFVIRGNHDAMSAITGELTLPQSVTVFGGRAQAVDIACEAPFAVAIHGVSFRDRHAPDSLLDKFKPPVAGACNIALLHTSLNGAPGHDPYAPCSVAELHAMGFDYWALGHIHQRAVYEGASTIVMAGIPQGRDIGESGAKSVSLVTVADDRTITVEERVVAVAQFERVGVDLSGVEDWRAVVEAMAGALRRARAAAACPHLVARLVLTGASPLAWALRRDGDRLLGDATVQAEIIGATWIDKVECAVSTPVVQDASAGGDPVLELGALIEEEILSSPGFRAAFADIEKDLRAQLPAVCRGLFGADETTLEATLDALAREGAQDVLARLHRQSNSGEG